MVSAERNALTALDEKLAANEALRVAKENQKEAAQFKASVMTAEYDAAVVELEKLRREHAKILEEGVMTTLWAGKPRNAAKKEVCSLNG